jgi:hypothetical protein
LVIEEGALGDMLLVEGNPLEELSMVVDYDRNLMVIMKDCVVYKNSLP